jgi:hypothetical protein
VNAALAIMQPKLPYPDLLQVYMAAHLALAEDVQAGRTSLAQGNAILTQKWSELVAEEQRRMLANRTVVAQEHSAAAARDHAGQGAAAHQRSELDGCVAEECAGGRGNGKGSTQTSRCV